MSYHLSSHPLYSISHRASASITFICPNCYLMLAPLILSNIEVTPLFPRILIPNLISPSMYTHPYQNPPFMKLAFSEHECSWLQYFAPIKQSQFNYHFVKLTFMFSWYRFITLESRGEPPFHKICNNMIKDPTYFKITLLGIACVSSLTSMPTLYGKSLNLNSKYFVLFLLNKNNLDFRGCLQNRQPILFTPLWGSSISILSSTNSIYYGTLPWIWCVNFQTNKDGQRTDLPYNPIFWAESNLSLIIALTQIFALSYICFIPLMQPIDIYLASM